MTDPTYRIAVSTWALDHKLAPGAPEWSAFNASFTNQSLNPFDFARAIYDGHPFTTWHANGWRTSANYVCGQHLGLDFDAGDQTNPLQ